MMPKSLKELERWWRNGSTLQERAAFVEKNYDIVNTHKGWLKPEQVADLPYCDLDFDLRENLLA